MNIEKLQADLRQFRDSRNWHRFHTPQNLAQAVAVEAGELLECFLWGDSWQKLDRERAAEEIADVVIYVLQLADLMEVDIETAVDLKIRANAKKYPEQKELFGKPDQRLGPIQCDHKVGLSGKAPGQTQVCDQCGEEVITWPQVKIS